MKDFLLTVGRQTIVLVTNNFFQNSINTLPATGAFSSHKILKTWVRIRRSWKFKICQSVMQKFINKELDNIKQLPKWLTLHFPLWRGWGSGEEPLTEEGENPPPHASPLGTVQSDGHINLVSTMHDIRHPHIASPITSHYQKIPRHHWSPWFFLNFIWYGYLYNLNFW